MPSSYLRECEYSVLVFSLFLTMWNLGMRLGLINIAGHATPVLKLHWLCSVFGGILICKIIYDLTASISAYYFNGYNKLKDIEKVEWNSRGFSTFHALFVAAGSLYLLFVSDLLVNVQDELMINRSSFLSDNVLGVSVGYFLSDLALIFYHYPALGGMEYVVHHVFSMFSIILSLWSGQAQIYVLMLLFTECTTPFVNLRWYLDTAGFKKFKIYIYNGIALFFGWLVARILLFVYCFYHMFVHFDQAKQVFPWGFYSLMTVPPVLSAMNLVWFWKITNGMVKTLRKAGHSK